MTAWLSLIVSIVSLVIGGSGLGGWLVARRAQTNWSLTIRQMMKLMEIMLPELTEDKLRRGSEWLHELVSDPWRLDALIALGNEVFGLVDDAPDP